MVRYSDTHPSENAILITLYQVDKHPREKCDRPCNVIVGAVITVEPCQKVFKYADIHPSENTISITMQQLDTHTLRRSVIDPAMKQWKQGSQLTNVKKCIDMPPIELLLLLKMDR